MRADERPDPHSDLRPLGLYQRWTRVVLVIALLTWALMLPSLFWRPLGIMPRLTPILYWNWAVFAVLSHFTLLVSVLLLRAQLAPRIGLPRGRAVFFVASVLLPPVLYALVVAVTRRAGRALTDAGARVPLFGVLDRDRWMLGPGRCRACGYDRAGLVLGEACPECGTPEPPF